MKDVKIFASCHNHSCFSDAQYSPEKIAELAHGLGHGGIILTDHDTVRGAYFMNKAARKLGLKSILGCEFSTYHRGVGVHLLGFDFNPDNKKMKELLAYCSSVQTSRTELMFKWGLERGTLREGISWQDVLDDHPYNDYICCEQVFDSMEKRGIYIWEEYKEFRAPNFSYKLGLEDKIFEITGKSYSNVSTERVVNTILEAGGVPVVAHPHGLRKHANDFLNMGVMGFETRFPGVGRGSDGTIGEHEFLEEICEEKNLYKMGGSDHSGVLSGNLSLGKEYEVSENCSGISEEDFMNIYERRFG